MKLLLFIAGLIIGAGGFYGYVLWSRKGLDREKIRASNFQITASAPIDQNKAKTYQANYMAACKANGEKESDILKSLKVEKKAVDDIFSNPNCTGLRLYLAKKSEPGNPLVGDYTIVVVGYGSDNENINSKIWDESSPCPSDCPKIDF
jgi:hypothetical protein